MFSLILSVLGRILLSCIFIVAGLSKVLNWESNISFIVETCAKGHLIFNSTPIDMLLSLISNHATVSLALATFCELFGGALVLLGLFTRFGAFLLIVFLIPTTIIFHPFWALAPVQAEIELSAFMKNIAILGGLMVVLAFGSGFSFFGKKARE